MESELINSYTVGQPWMIAVILFSLSLVAIVRFSYSKVQSQYFKSLISRSLPSGLVDEEKVLSHRASLILLINTGVFFSLLMLVFSENYFPRIFKTVDFSGFLIIFLFVSLLFTLRVLLQMGFKIIFEEDYGIREYLLNTSFINMLLGLLLIPLTFGTLFMSKQYHPLFFKTFIILLVLLQVFKIFKGSLIAIKYKVNVLYFILYLCCLELIPILVLFKEVIFNA